MPDRSNWRRFFHFHVVLEDVASPSERWTETELTRELKDALAHTFRSQPVEIDVVELERIDE